MYKMFRKVLLIVVCIVILLITGMALELPFLEEIRTTNKHAADNVNDGKPEDLLKEEDGFTVEIVKVSEVVCEANKELEKTEEMEAKEQEIMAKLMSATILVDQMSLTYAEENIELEQQVVQNLEEVKGMLEDENAYFDDSIWGQYNETKKNFEQYLQMLQSIANKMSTIKITNSTNMSQTFDFTVEELSYILRNAKGTNGKLIIEDWELAEIMAKTVVETVEEYPVNELFAISVMSFETGYFTSKLVRVYNNFGGVKDPTTGDYSHFHTLEEGITATVKCLNSNLKGSKTAKAVNASYCAPIIEVDENGEEVEHVYGWAENVLSIMMSYARAINSFKCNDM